MSEGTSEIVTQWYRYVFVVLVPVLDFICQFSPIIERKSDDEVITVEYDFVNVFKCSIQT